MYLKNEEGRESSHKNTWTTNSGQLACNFPPTKAMFSAYSARWVLVNWNIWVSFFLPERIIRYQTRMSLSVPNTQDHPDWLWIQLIQHTSGQEHVQLQLKWNGCSRCNIHACWYHRTKGYSWRSLAIVPRVSGSGAGARSAIDQSNRLYTSRYSWKQWHQYDSWPTPKIMEHLVQN